MSPLISLSIDITSYTLSLIVWKYRFPSYSDNWLSSIISCKFTKPGRCLSLLKFKVLFKVFCSATLVVFDLLPAGIELSESWVAFRSKCIVESWFISPYLIMCSISIASLAEVYLPTPLKNPGICLLVYYGSMALTNFCLRLASSAFGSCLMGSYCLKYLL